MNDPYPPIMILPHIHWDREWYAPEAVCQERLVHVIDSLMELLKNRRDYPSILLDGQVGILDDYLGENPESFAILTELLCDGRFHLGPWYCPPDLNLPRGESVIRNLLIGATRMSAFNQRTDVAYLPDSFGHFSQLPQVLLGFGLNAFVFWRGMPEMSDDLGQVFWWQAPDNSQVMALCFVPSYSNARGLGYSPEGKFDVDLIQAHATALMDRQRDYLTGGPHVFAIRDPTPELPIIIDKLRDLFPGRVVAAASLDELCHSIDTERLQAYCGDLRAGRYCSIYPGTYSTRMWVKTETRSVEDYLLNLLEPLCAFAEWLGLPYPAGSIRNLWERFLKNQFHDTICGCCVDDVYRDVKWRLNAIKSAAAYLVHERLQFICDQVLPEADVPGLVVFNPHSYSVDWLIETQVALPVSWGQGTISIFSYEGEPIPFDVLGSSSFPERGDQRLPVRKHVAIRFQAKDLPPFGFRFYRLEKGKSLLRHRPWQAKREFRTDNLSLNILSNGGIDVSILPCGRSIAGLGILEDEGDAGDTYNFAAASTRPITRFDTGQANVKVREGANAFIVETYQNLKVPAYFDSATRTKVSKKATVTVKTRASVWKEKRLIQFHLEIENQARDHRLRVALPTGLAVSQAAVLRPFVLQEELVTTPVPCNVVEWDEPPVPDRPHNGLILLSDGSQSFAVLAAGLSEYALRKEADGTVTVLLTLLRSVGWLSHNELSVRRVPAGPCIPTPEAQCLGISAAEFAVIFDETDVTKILQAEQAHACPPFAFQPHYLGLIRQFQTTWRLVSSPIDQVRDSPGAQCDVSFLSVEGEGIVTSCLKKAEDGRGYILRLVNYLPQAGCCRIKFRHQVDSWLCRLDETTLSYLGYGYELEIDFEPAQIKTIRLDATKE